MLRILSFRIPQFRINLIPEPGPSMNSVSLRWAPSWNIRSKLKGQRKTKKFGSDTSLVPNLPVYSRSLLTFLVTLSLYADLPHPCLPVRLRDLEKLTPAPRGFRKFWNFLIHWKLVNKLSSFDIGIRSIYEWFLNRQNYKIYTFPFFKWNCSIWTPDQWV